MLTLPCHGHGGAYLAGLGTHQALDTTLNRQVAIKVVLPDIADDPDRLARFRREAQVLASLNHPHIAQIHFAPSQLIQSNNGHSAEFIKLTANPAQGSDGFCFDDSPGPDVLSGTDTSSPSIPT